MIVSIFHKGSGLGNQLHRYVATRTLASHKGTGWGMVNTQGFKGKDFMDLDMNASEDWEFHIEEPAGKVIPHLNLPLWEEKTNYYNPEFNFIDQDTIIDGEFQDERYWDIDRVREWLKVEPLEMPDDLVVIGFRGGEFQYVPDLFLPKEYWQEAMSYFPGHRFEVHTDDPETAQKFFPGIPCIHDIGLNWRSVRYAKNLIIANSSFYIFPALLNENADLIIAPRYWARRNTGEWHMPQNYYKKFLYI